MGHPVGAKTTPIANHVRVSLRNIEMEVDIEAHRREGRSTRPCEGLARADLTPPHASQMNTRPAAMTTPALDRAPLILLPADVKEFESYRWHAVASTYIDAIVKATDAIPVVLPAIGGRIDVDAVLDRVDGVLITGARSNVHPANYGVEETDDYAPFDQERDLTTLPLIAQAIERGIPLFVICRGFQELNVAFGGTLSTEVQTLPGRMDHRAPVSDDHDVRFAIRHDVNLVPGGVFEEILGTTTIRVNSLHRQAVNRLADILIAEATAPDGTIEAVRVKDATGFALGVQWHPEYWVTSDEPSKKLFAAFGDAVRAYHEGRRGLYAAPHAAE